MHRIVSLFFPLAALATLLACTTVQDTGRKQLILTPASQENKMGVSQFNNYKKSKRVSSNASYNGRLRSVARRLEPIFQRRMPGSQWEFVVFEDQTPNAFALPGGKVGIHTGMFQLVQNDAQLAAVIGHEVGHVVARHGGERMTSQLLGAAATILTGVAMRDAAATQRNTTVAAVGAASTLGVLRFSRSQELEADQLGALYMAQAGYDPRQSIELWKRMAAYRQRAGGGKKVPAYFSTHPSDEQRIQRLRAFMPEAMAQWRG
ncbi:MAG: M48 family metallopeptidase [Verrucomicrobiota bacterium]